jgi:hypothetical protein
MHLYNDGVVMEGGSDIYHFTPSGSLTIIHSGLDCQVLGVVGGVHSIHPCFHCVSDFSNHRKIMRWSGCRTRWAKWRWHGLRYRPRHHHLGLSTSLSNTTRCCVRQVLVFL